VVNRVYGRKTAEFRDFRVYEMALMTKSAYAKHRVAQGHQCSKQFLAKPAIVERLRPAMVADAEGRMLVDSDKADAIFAETRDPSKYLGRATAGEPKARLTRPDGYEAMRTRREQLKVQEAELDLAERKRQTIARSGVVAAGATAGQLIRGHLQARNRRIAELAATMTDAREIKQMLDADDRVMLETVSDDFMRRIQGAGDEQPTVN
jgi:hypothetical protein